MNNYHIYTEIGRGHGSIIYKGREKKTINYVAIKSVEKRYKKKVLNEVAVLYSLSHPNILRFLNWYETSKHIWLLVDYCCGGDLLTMLRLDQAMPEVTCKRFAYDIVNGLQYIHSSGYLYVDLKPSNILINEYGTLLLCDFGLARKVPQVEEDLIVANEEIEDENTTAATDGNDTNTTTPAGGGGKRGSPYYIPPELFFTDGVHSFSSDLWALGCVLYELATGRTPFHRKTLEETVEAIVNEEYEQLPRSDESTMNGNHSAATDPSQQQQQSQQPPSSPHRFSSTFSHFLSRLLTKDPSLRMTWDELRSHPWLCDDSVLPERIPTLEMPEEQMWRKMLEAKKMRDVVQQQQQQQQLQQQQQAAQAQRQTNPSSSPTHNRQQKQQPDILRVNSGSQNTSQQQQQQQPYQQQHQRQHYIEPASGDEIEEELDGSPQSSPLAKSTLTRATSNNSKQSAHTQNPQHDWDTEDADFAQPRAVQQQQQRQQQQQQKQQQQQSNGDEEDIEIEEEDAYYTSPKHSPAPPVRSVTMMQQPQQQQQIAMKPPATAPPKKQPITTTNTPVATSSTTNHIRPSTTIPASRHQPPSSAILHTARETYSHSSNPRAITNELDRMEYELVRAHAREEADDGDGEDGGEDGDGQEGELEIDGEEDEEEYEPDLIDAGNEGVDQEYREEGEEEYQEAIALNPRVKSHHPKQHHHSPHDDADEEAFPMQYHQPPSRPTQSPPQHQRTPSGSTLPPTTPASGVRQKSNVHLVSRLPVPRATTAASASPSSSSSSSTIHTSASRKPPPSSGSTPSSSPNMKPTTPSGVSSMSRGTAASPVHSAAASRKNVVTPSTPSSDTASARSRKPISSATSSAPSKKRTSATSDPRSQPTPSSTTARSQKPTSSSSSTTAPKPSRTSHAWQ